MLKQFEELKLAFIKKKVQVIILSPEGWVQDSCESVFELTKLKKSIFDIVPLFDKIKNVLHNLEVNQSIILEKCDWNWKDTTYFLDIEITNYLLDTQVLTRLIIEDKTFEYEALEEAQQIQSSQISGEHTELLNTILQLKKELQNKDKFQDAHEGNFKKVFFTGLQDKFEEPLVLIQSWLKKIEKSIDLTYLIKTKSAIHFLNQIIGKEYYFTGIEKDIVSFENTEISLKNLIDEMLVTFDFHIKEKEIKIEFDYQEVLPLTFKGKKKYIQYLFFHLFFSILKYCSGQDLHIKITRKSFEGNLYQLNCEFITQNRFVNDFDILKGIEEQNLFLSQLVKRQGGDFNVFLTENNLNFKVNLALISSLELVDNQQNKALTGVKLALLSKQKSNIDLLDTYCEQLIWDFEVFEEASELINNTKFDVYIVDIDTVPLNNLSKIGNPILILLPFSHSNLWQRLKELGFDKQLKAPFSKQVFYDKVITLLIKSDTMYNEKIDLSYIEDIVEDNPEMLGTLLGMLLDNIKEYPGKMASEFHSQDFYQLRETAHKFKSCTAYTGLVEFNDVLTEIERSDEFNLANSEIEEKVNFINAAAKKVQVQVEDKLEEIKQESTNAAIKQEDTNETEV